jgi:protein SCO1
MAMGDPMLRKLSTVTIAAGPIVAIALLLTRPAAASGLRWRADYLPDVTLTTHRGQVVHLYDDLLKDKVVAIEFIFTHCQFSCPISTARLADLQPALGARMGKDVFFYSITLDPERDTPAVLAAYARKFHAGPGWLFLTGKREDIQLLQQKLGFYGRADEATDEHSPMLLVASVASGRWVRLSAVDNPRYLARAVGSFLGAETRGVPRAAETWATGPKPTSTRGERLFSAQCAGCHTIGSGERLGPDLLGVTSRRERSWLARFIASPDAMRAQGDPTARALHARYPRLSMPDLRLCGPEVTALVEYLSAMDASAARARRRAGRRAGD